MNIYLENTPIETHYSVYMGGGGVDPYLDIIWISELSLVSVSFDIRQFVMLCQILHDISTR
jgi:hypothetical protein